MNIGVLALIAFMSGLSIGIAVDRIIFWLRPVGDQPAGDQPVVHQLDESQVPPQAFPFGDTGSPLLPFHRLRPPPPQLRSSSPGETR